MVNIAKDSTRSKTLVKCHRSQSSPTCSLYAKDYLDYKLWSSHIKCFYCVVDSASHRGGNNRGVEGTHEITEFLSSLESVFKLFLVLAT